MLTLTRSSTAMSVRFLLALACATRTSGFVAPGPSPLRADAKIATRRRGAPELWDGYLQALEATPLPVKCATKPDVRVAQASASRTSMLIAVGTTESASTSRQHRRQN